MKTLKQHYDKIKEKNPYWSSIICFNETVLHQKFKPKTISYWFKKLVDKDDYCQKDKKEILAFLDKLTNMPEDGKKQTQNDATTTF